MSSVQGNKNWIYALGAGAVVIIGALIFHQLSQGKEEAQAQASKVLEEIDALGPPKKGMNGLLAFDYYQKVFFIIQKHAKTRFAVEKADLLKRRREFLKDGKMSDYKEVVKEMIQKEEQMCGDLLQDAMEHIGMNEQEFMQMHQIYMSNPQTQQALMQAQFQPAAGSGPPKLTRNKTKEIFLDSEEKKLESMKKMMSDPQAAMGGMGGGDPMESMMEMMVEQAKLSDDMYERHNIDEEEFNMAMIHYNLMNDPEIQRKVMQNMQKLGLGGGMGGGMGQMM